MLVRSLTLPNRVNNMEQLIIPAGLRITLIVATDIDRAIGKDNKIPWSHKADMKSFRLATTGNMVLMGRKTFESMGNRRLPKRHNIVLSSTLDGRFLNEPCLYPTVDSSSIALAPTAQAAVDTAEAIRSVVNFHIGQDMTLFVIGGQALYEQFLPYASMVYHNVIHTKVEGADTFFPEMDQADWSIDLQIEHGAAHGEFPWRQQIFARKK